MTHFHHFSPDFGVVLVLLSDICHFIDKKKQKKSPD